MRSKDDARSRIPGLERQAKQHDYDAQDFKEKPARAIYVWTMAKQIDYDEEDVIGFEALYTSMMKTRKNVLWKDSVAAYYHRGVERTDRLSSELHSGKYKASPPKHFMVTSPKPRAIASVAYRDRVYQRSLNDNVVYPVMTQGFIYDNFACQHGKGTDPARAKMKEFLHRHYRKHGTDGWVAQFDIHGYYPNMRHDLTEENFRRKLPKWAYDRVERILREQYSGDVGYNPGSQLIQIAGISMLDGVDHFIKEKLRVRLYIRYMDDLILIHENLETLEAYMKAIIREFDKSGFAVNPKKTRIFALKEGIMFLGFIFRLTESGKVIMTADPSKVKAARKKYRRLVAKSKRGELPKEHVDASFQTWLDHLSHGNSWKLIHKLKDYYNALWEDDGNGDQEKDITD